MLKSGCLYKYIIYTDGSIDLWESNFTGPLHETKCDRSKTPLRAGTIGITIDHEIRMVDRGSMTLSIPGSNDDVIAITNHINPKEIL